MHEAKIPWEPMPFYIVTHTSLVEADDEQAAAQKGVDQVRAGGPVTVAVKSDETTIHHIDVAPKLERQSGSPINTLGPYDTLRPALPESAPLNTQKEGFRLGRIVGRALAFLNGRG